MVVESYMDILIPIALMAIVLLIIVFTIEDPVKILLILFITTFIAFVIFLVFDYKSFFMKFLHSVP